MISNQIKVLIQQMRLRNMDPWKILLCHGLRWSLREEMRNKVEYRVTDQGDFFGGIQVVIDESCVEPMILVRPLKRATPLEENYESN
jgi:hypothetical protein